LSGAALLIVLVLGVGASTVGASRSQASSEVFEWLSGAAAAMGGGDGLSKLAAVETSGMSVWYHREQSERPEGPWLTTFTDFTDLRNFGDDAVRRTSRTRGFSTNDWVDSTEWTAASTVLVTAGVSVSRASGRLIPAATPPDLAVLPVGLTPERVVGTARKAADLHAEPDEVVDGYPHHVVAFSFAGARIRLILNVPSLLPKAVEVNRAHADNMFLAPWGDVTQRVTFGMWTRERDGLRYPRVWEFSTEGQTDGSVYVTRLRTNPPLDDTELTLPADVRQRLVADRPRIADLPFGPAGVTNRPVRELAPGIVKVPGRFDVIEVGQDDGVVIVEAPLSSDYSAKAIADAWLRFGKKPVKALVTTTDAWPHIGGIREYVALGIPVYALDLNVPILMRLLSATYRSFPDTLAKAPKAPRVTVVSNKTTVGSGTNRFEIYPLRTATGERQMMIYWPDHRLLYSSDLFTIRDDFVFLPQQVSEAVDAVARERLAVTTAFGMHYDPLPWAAVQKNALPAAVPR
jgi:glyoxylase-like metal-dependent hydrolase (beta-lactamase superfamily II)